MLVTRTNFDAILFEISRQYFRSLDTETTGLLPFHGDKLFSIIIGTKEGEYYFNFNQYPNLPDDLLLGEEHLRKMQERLFSGDAYWFIQKAIFDLPILAQDNLHLDGTVHCTKVGGRVQYNEHHKYTLEAQGERIGCPKDKTVDEYIKKHKLSSQREVNGKKFKQKRFDLVPFEIITKYGLQDAKVTFKLGMHQLEQIEKRAQRMPANKPNIKDLHANELRLEKTIHRMQMRGAKIDNDFCRRAVEHNSEQMERATSAFKRETGVEFILSGKVFSDIFAAHKDAWSYTDKGNPSFDADALAKIPHPAAKCILDYKKAKAEIDFYYGFIYHADKEGAIHTDFNSGGTRTGRFSSSNPNLQNLKRSSEDDLKEEFVVRRAFIPRPGFFFAMLDYDQVEYRMMADYANCTALIDKVLGGLDVHTATAEIAGVTRYEAKTVNFGTLYGQGIAALARDLGVTENKARAIQGSIFNAAPEIKTLIRAVTRTAEKRGFIFNWLGRVCYYPKRNLCYKATNALMQGGAGDVVKKAMNAIDEILLPLQSSMILNIHDELVFEIAYGEEDILDDIKGIMENIYPYKRLPLTVGIDYSEKSLADKQPWKGRSSLGEKGRDEIQGEDSSTVGLAPKQLDRENSAGRLTGHA